MKTRNLLPVVIFFYLFVISSCGKQDIRNCLLTADVTITDIDPLTKKLTCTAAGGIEPYTYRWEQDGGNIADIPEIIMHSLIYDDTLTLYLNVRDATDCEITKPVTIIWPPNICGSDTVVDSDGNIYNVVTIGSQCWMKENLEVNAGITQVTDSAQWASMTSPAWCYYDNHSYNGKLYNWYAVASGNLCPNGWHIPTETDWQQLTTFLGDELLAGGKMKSTTGWDSPNTGATNSSGFSAVGSGYRSGTSGIFYGVHQATGFWASTQTTDSTAYNRGLNYNSGTLKSIPATKREGYSCRCVKD